MASNEKAAETQFQTDVGESLESSTWLAPFSSATFLSLQNTIGNRAVSQLLQADMVQAPQNGNGHKPARALIVNDDAIQLEPGQMRKTEFLEQLKSSVCMATEDLLRDTMWSAMGCPYIERWFSHHAEQDSAYVERALRRFAPDAFRAASAHDYIPIVTERVCRGLRQWSETGEMTGVPEELKQQGVVSVALTAIGRAVSGAVSAIGSAIGVK